MKIHRSLLWKSLQSLARILTTVLFDLKVYGRRNIPRHGGVLIVSNHQGNLDPVLLAVRLDRPLNYIAKSELFERWYFAALLRALNAFPVRQGTGDVAAVRETIQRLQEGHLLNIFPEGARSTDGEIHPLLRGVALIVRRARVPIVPAVIVGSFEAWPIHRALWRRHPVFVRFGKPIDLWRMTNGDDDKMIAVIDDTLHRMFDELRNDVRSREAGQSARTPSRNHVIT